MSATPGRALVARLFRAASALLCLLPRSITLPLGRAAGRAAWFLMPGRRRVASENLAIAYGAELTAAERGRMARACFGHAAAIAVDLLTLPRVARDPAAHGEIAPGSLEALRGALAQGRGAILLAGHFGLFESMGILLGHHGVRLHFVAKPFDNQALDAEINRVRGLTGNGFVHKGGAKAKLREILARGECVAIVVDQHVSARDRCWIPFFGLPAATTRSLGTLALETGAPVVPIHAYPLPRGRVRCVFGPVLVPRRTGDEERDAESFVRECIAEMERATRVMPEAWLWLHRRWKVRPRTERDGYPSYSISSAEEEAKRAAARAARERAAAAAPE